LKDRSRLTVTFMGLGLTAAAAPSLLAWALGDPVRIAHILGGVAAALLMAAAWNLVNQRLLRPTAELSDDLQRHLESPGVEHPPLELGLHSLDQLPNLVGRLRDAFRIQRQDLRNATRSADKLEEERRAWLDVALRELGEGVVLCSLDHQILYHNHAAERMLPGIGRSGTRLRTLVPPRSLDHAMDCLMARLNSFGKSRRELVGSVLFCCLTGGGKRLLQGQMSLTLTAGGNPAGYVVVFRNLSEIWADVDPGESVRLAIIRDLRGPLGSLYAAAQMLTDYPDMAPETRDTFVKVIGEESARMNDRLSATEAAASTLTVWPLADIHFSELFSTIAAALGQRLDIKLTLVGVPLWLHGDSHSLMEAFLALFAALHAQTGSMAFDMECMLGDKLVYVDIVWKGDPIPDHRLTSWMGIEINAALGPQTIGQVLEHHSSQPWSLAKRGGFAALRVPLPLPQRPQFKEEEWNDLGQPPTLADAGLRATLLAHTGTGNFHGRALERMPFIVVAALIPLGARQAGDHNRITALGAVRVEDGRLLTAGTFERRLSGGDNSGAPPLSIVLPQLWKFAGESVLAVHDAGTCLGLFDDGNGPGMNVLVVDTQVISRLLDPDREDHSLAAVARRLGVRVGEHRSEIGKALLTAEVLLGQMERLEAARITTFDQLVEAIRAHLTSAETQLEKA
jgi:DNA polymerase-3 subunit epsilon